MTNDPRDDINFAGLPGDKPKDPLDYTDEERDSQVINFGKHNGKTPIQLFEAGGKDKSYIIWAYETVERRDRPLFCSEALYKAAGGRGVSAMAQRLDKQAMVRASAKNQPASAPATVTRNVGPGFDRYEDTDDDIPF